MVIFLQTVSYEEPKWQTENSIIGESPGLGLRPGQEPDLIDSSIIVFNKDSKNTDQENNWQEWAERISSFLESYTAAKNETKGKNCDADGIKATKDKACLFDIEKLGACGKSNYGYDQGKPCIFLKLNRIYGLENKEYNAEELPEDMPEELKTHIGKQTNKDQVWVHCQGKNPADKEILENIEYYPATRGFSNNYFPYMRQDDYLNPLVAVQFSPRLEGGRGIGQLIHIECRAWAQNIGYNRRDKIGCTAFELQVFDNDSIAKLNNGE